MPYIRITGRVFGPFDESQLLEMKAKGRVTRTTEMSDNRSDWQLAESFEWLFPSRQTSSPSSPSSSSANEPADWFYSLNGTEGFGPVTAAAIEQMLQSGQLSGNSYVWQQGQNARFVKNEPRFSNPGASSSTSPRPGEGDGDTGTSEPVDTGGMLRHLAASLGWLMFLKVTFLIGLIFQGLYLLGASLWLISFAIGADRVTAFLIALLSIAVGIGFYALSFKAFHCLWKYHTHLSQAVASNRESDLTNAFQSLFLFWKWTSIYIIVLLAVSLLITIMGIVASGFGSGWGAGLLIKFFPS
ncbi:MAG: DUF4339 domain-containing protein [Planctomycetaceae bacterium]|jgi:hypothetical protein|nr:DUF4339 domain-containing protein [Planctomycetaceae bacterium]